MVSCHGRTSVADAMATSITLGVARGQTGTATRLQLVACDLDVPLGAEAIWWNTEMPRAGGAQYDVKPTTALTSGIKGCIC